MKIRYFAETDTALFEFSEQEPAETRALSENVYADFDYEGNLVGLTIEHAKSSASLDELSFINVM